MQVEICVGSLEAIRLLQGRTFDRIETCIALEQGGLTPSLAMVEWIRDTFDFEQHILIRLRPGGFVYSMDEIMVMRNQIHHLYKSGMRGFVVGALTKSGDIHQEALEVWKRAAPEATFTFHRAFDEVVDWKKGMDLLVKLGFSRILTSGGVPAIDPSAEIWETYLNYAAKRIEIMAGGGLKPEHISMLKNIGVDAIHFSGTVRQTIDENSMFHSSVLVPNTEKLDAYFQVL
jgi:copper homeostasis protein